MLLLTVMGLIVLVPPVVTLFNRDSTVFGVPQIVVYLFFIWLVLILGTVLLTHFVAPDPTAPREEGDG